MVQTAELPHADTPVPAVWIPPVSLVDLHEARIHVLLWQVRGSADLIIDGRIVHLRAGSACWVPAGTPHAITVHANSVLTPLFFEADETATTLRQATMVAVDRDLHTLLLAHGSSWQTVIQHSVNIGRQILARIEGQLPPPWSLAMPKSDAARKIAELLRFNPGDSRSVDELAESAHVSARTVERAFLAETGITLRQWRLRTRMESAATLLRADATVDGVSARVGYSNVNAFRRAFHGHFGMSPTVYRRHHAVD